MHKVSAFLKSVNDLQKADVYCRSLDAVVTDKSEFCNSLECYFGKILKPIS